MQIDLKLQPVFISKILCFTFAFFILNNATAQVLSFKKSYFLNSTEQAYFLQQTNDSGFFVGGLTDQNLFGYIDNIYLVKTNKQGDTELTIKPYDSFTIDPVSSVNAEKDTNLRLYSNILSDHNHFLTVGKYVGLSRQIKYVRYHLNMYIFGLEIINDKDGGYIITGHTIIDTSILNWHPFLLKINKNLDSVWFHTYGKDSEDFYGEKVIQANSGEYYISCTKSKLNTAANGSDMYLIKTDSNGKQIWMKNYGGVGDDAMGGIIQMASGSLIFAGTKDPARNGFPNIYIAGIDTEGNISWSKSYPGNYFNEVSDIATKEDNTFILAGDFGGRNTLSYLYKFNASGDTIWTRTYDDWSDSLQRNLYARAVISTFDGGYAFATSSFDINGYSYYTLIKTDGMGYYSGIEYADTKPEIQLSVYPNPFQSSATISYNLPGTKTVDIRVFDILGRQIAILENGIEREGKYSFTFSPSQSSFPSSQMYILRMSLGDEVIEKTLFLAR